MTTVAPRLIEYPGIRWNPDWCKRCYICVEACPRQALDAINRYEERIRKEWNGGGEETHE